MEITKEKLFEELNMNPSPRSFSYTHRKKCSTP
jgi:hypothetical protein